MTVEALVFFVSAFERPGNEYHWEEVFPGLKSKNPLDRPDFANTSMSNLVNQSENMIEDEANASGVNIHIGGKSVSSLGNLDVDADDTKTLSNLNADIDKCIKTARADGIMNGFTDADWDQLQSDLQGYKLDEYLAIFQKYVDAASDNALSAD
jgi:hypothetical protein